MRTLTAMGLACALAAPTWGANITSFTGFLRKAPAPVTVPGGTTTFVRGGCSTTGDAAAIEAIVDQLVDGVVDRLMPDNPV